jgi:hypothetical protein
VAVFFVVPVLVKPSLVGFDANLVTGVEWHYTGVLGPGDRLAAGLKLFDDVRMFSGFLPTLGLALFEKAFGSMSFGRHIFAVQLMQLLFLFVALRAYRLWSPRDPVYLPIALLLVTPWISTLHAAVLYPNQSAWRALAFPVAVLAIVALRRQAPLAAPIALGALCGVLVLLNTEIGICASVGLLVSQVTRVPITEYRYLLTCGAQVVVGGLLSLATWVVVFRLGLGYWPSPRSLDEVAFLIQYFAEGYGGIKFKVLAPLPALILCHAAYVVVLCGLRWQCGRLTPNAAARMGIATMIVLWFAYYAKGPHFWNLWTLTFLYSFLLTSIIQFRHIKGLSISGIQLRRDWRLWLLAFVILPGAALSNILLVQAAKRQLVPAFFGERTSIARVSDVKFDSALGQALEKKAGYLRGATKQYGDQMLYLTVNSFTMPLLTGYYPKLPAQDVFAETITHADFARLVNRIEQIAPRVILVDSPDSTFSGYTEEKAFLARVMKNLDQYSPVGPPVDGWQVWARKAR